MKNGKKVDCLYHPKKGDKVLVVSGASVWVRYLRQQTLRTVTTGEMFYADEYGKLEYVALNDGEGNRYISVACPDKDNCGRLVRKTLPKSTKVWRVRGTRFVPPVEIKRACEFEVTKYVSQDDVDVEVVVYGVAVRKNGKLTNVAKLPTMADVDDFCYQYRLKEYGKECERNLFKR